MDLRITNIEKAITKSSSLFRILRSLECYRSTLDRDLDAIAQELTLCRMEHAFIAGTYRKDPDQPTTLHLIRGMPGSGKSTFANTLGVLVLEADDQFKQEDGTFKFDKSELSLAHFRCQERTFLALASGLDVAVANTFTTKAEILSYVNLANYLPNVTIIIHKCTGKFENIHNVPISNLERKAERWEDIEGEILYDPKTV